MGTDSPIETFDVDLLTVRVYRDAAVLAQAAVEAARARLLSALADRTAARVLLAAGRSQRAFLDELLGCGGLDWRRVTFFQIDEYLGLAADHPGSLACYLRERVERRVPTGAVHYLDGDADEPLDECRRYGRLLRGGPLDLCCLGLGDTGHIAFNEPSVADFSDTDAVKLVKLDPRSRRQQVEAGYFDALEAVPRYALTVTIPVLCAASTVLCLAPGRRKAEVVRRLLRGPVGTDCPASCLREQPQATLLLDRASARLL